MPGEIFGFRQKSFDQLHQLETTLKEKKDDNLTHYFFLKMGDSFETVEKQSLKGFWISFKSLISHVFGKKSEVDTSTEALKRIVESVNRSLKFVAKEPVDFQKFIQNISKHLDVECTFPLHVTSVPEHAAPVAHVAMKTFSTIEEEKLEFTSKLAPYAFTGLEQQTIASFLIRHPQKSQVMETLEKNNENTKDLLIELLIEAQLLATETESKTLMSALDKIRPETGMVEPPVDLDSIALILGDAFILDSKEEGDVSASKHAQLAAEYLEQAKAEGNIDTQKADELHYLLTEMVDLRKSAENTTDALRDDIKKKLENSKGETQRCIIDGGWVKHEVVYEIEKKQNGKYAFRVYNEGAGIERHRQLVGGTKQKAAGCIAIDDIPEKLLFRRSFLAGIQGLCKTGAEEAPGILNEKILPLLDGKEEEVDPTIQYYLSPQRSGTCTYRSLQAFLAHTMTAKDYKNFKFEFKLFLLNRYRSSLKTLLEKPIHANNYQATVKTYSLVKRCVEKFANSVNNLSGSVEQEKLKKATLTVNEFTVLLRELDQKVLAFEKKSPGINKLTAAENEKITTSKEALCPRDPDLYPTARIATDNLLQIESYYYQQINAIPGPTDKEFSKKVEEVLRGLAHTIIVSPGVEFGLYTLLFKKIGTLEAINNNSITFSRPDTLKLLQTLYNKVAGGSDSTSLEKYMLCIGFHCLAECALRQLSDGQRVLAKDFPSFLASPLVLQNLSYASCNDPFWVERYSELKGIAKKATSYNTISGAEAREEYLQMSSGMQKDIVAWWEQPGQPWNQKASQIKIDQLLNVTMLSDIQMHKVEKDIEELKADIKTLEDTIDPIKKATSDTCRKQIDIIKHELGQPTPDWGKVKKPEDNIEAYKKRLENIRHLKIQLAQNQNHLEHYQATKKLKEEITSRKESLTKVDISILEDRYDQEIRKSSAILSTKKNIFEEEKNQTIEKFISDEYRALASEKVVKDISTEIENAFLEKENLKNKNSDLHSEMLVKGLKIAKLTSLSNNIHENLNKISKIDKSIDVIKNKVNYITELKKNAIDHSNKSLEHQKSLQGSKNGINALNAHPNEIDNDLQYWPYGWEEKDVSKYQLSLSQKANFLFGKNDFFHRKLDIVDSIPTDVRDFFGQANRMQYLSRGAMNTRDNVHFQTERDDKGIKLKALRDTPSVIDTFKYDKNYQDATEEFKKAFVALRDVQGAIKESTSHRDFFDFQRAQIQGAQKSPLSSEQFMEIASLKQRSVQIESTLNFFEEHREYLADRNWVALFHSLLFQDDILLHDLQDDTQNAKIIERLKSFFSKVQGDAITVGNFTEVGNVIWTKSLVQSYIDHVNEKRRASGKTPLANSLANSTLFSLDDIKIPFTAAIKDPKNASHWPVLFEGLTAAVSRISDFSNKKPEDLGYIFLINALRSNFQIDNSQMKIPTREEACQSTKQNICRYFSQHADAQSSHFFGLAHQEALHLIYPTLENMIQDSYQKDCLRTQDASTRISFSVGRIASTNPSLGQRFSRLLELPQKELLKKAGIFADEKSKEKLEALRCSIDGNTTYIKDPTNTHPFFAIKNNALYMQLVDIPNKGATTWGKLREPGDTANELDHHLYAFSTNIDEAKLVFCNKEDFTATHRSNSEDYLQEIETQFTHTPSQGTFASFEAPDNTLYWSSPVTSKIKKIEFPRLNLSFSEKEGRFECKQFPGGFLSEEQQAVHLGPDTGFLTLESKDRTAKTVLVPVWDPQKGSDTKSGDDVLAFPYKYDFEANKNNHRGRYTEYTLDQGKLIPKTVEGRYHLASIYLEKGFQDEAESLLFDHNAEVTTRALTENEKNVLERIAYGGKSQELSGRKVRVQLHAVYLLERNAETKEVKAIGKQAKATTIDEINMAETQTEKKAHLLKEYHERLGHIRPLEETEVRFITPKEDESKPEFGTVETPKPITLSFERGNPPSYVPQPTLKQRFDYFKNRLSNTFPFDYTQIDQDYAKRGFLEHFQLLLSECEQIGGLETARARGLVGMLVYVSQFAKDEEIALAAKYLLSEIDRTQTLQIPQLTTFPQKVLLVKNRASVTEVVQSLPLLASTIKAADDEVSFLVEMRKKHLGEKPVVETTVKKESPLFNKTCPETGGDPSLERQFEKQQLDLAHAQEELAKEIRYEKLPTGNLATLKTTIQEKYDNEHDSLQEQERFLLENMTLALTSNPTSRLQFASKKRELPKLEEICCLASRLNADASLKKAYPELSSAAILSLKAAVTEYLTQKRYVQHLGRALQKIQDIQDEEKKSGVDPETINIMIDDLGRAMDQQPAFEKGHDIARAFLMLETTLNIKLRIDQVTNIEKFKEALANGDDTASQMIMGAGKTAVIQPILAFLFAQKGLSSVCIPAALFETVKKELAIALGSAYKQFVYSDPLTKALSEDVKYLEVYLKRIKEAKDRNAVLMITPQHKYVLASAFKESLYLKQQKRCELLKEICKVFREYEIAQIDEIDMNFDPTVVYKFPIGDLEAVHKQRGKLVSELVLELALDKDFAKTISIDFIDALQKRQAEIQGETYEAKGSAISEASYAAVVKPKLVDKALLLLKREIPDLDAVFDTPKKQEYLRSFLLQEVKSDAYIQERNQCVNTCSQKDLIGICAKSIDKILSTSLLKECGSHYSHDPKIDEGVYTARPYFAPHSPKPSVPSDPYELAILSVQNLLYEGIPEKAVRKILEDWRVEVEQASSVSDSYGFQEFTRILGKDAEKFSLMQIPPPDALISLLQKKLSEDKKSLMLFFDKYLLGQVRFSKESLSTTPISGLGGLSNHRFGYSGTPNEAILPDGMKVQEVVGTDGKTITVIEDKIKGGTSHIREYKKDVQSYTDMAKHRFKTEDDLYTLIDSGNWLKDVNIAKYAHTLLTEIQAEGKRGNIQGIVYPDRQGNWLTLQKDPDTGTFRPIPYEDSKLKPQERITIIPSKHETGTNIKQPPCARALNTIRKNMTLRDALQSVFRMRQILVGQQVDFAFTEDVKNHVLTQCTQQLFEKKMWNELRTCTADEFVGKLQTIEAKDEFEKFVKDKLLAHTQAWPSDKKERWAQVLSLLAPDFTITSERMWNYFEYNHTIEQRKKAELACQHRMREVIESRVGEKLFDAKTPEETMKIFNAINKRGFYTPKKQDTPFKEMCAKTEEVDQAVWVQKRIDGLCGLLDFSDPIVKEIFPDIIELTQSLDASIKDSKKALPAKMKISEGGLESEEGEIEIEVEVEVEQEIEIELELELGLEIHQEPPMPQERPYVPLAQYTNDGGYNIQDLLMQKQKAPPLQALFTKDREIVNSFFQTDEYTITYSPNLFPPGTFGREYPFTGRYLLAMKDGANKDTYMLMSNEDAERMKKGLLVEGIHIAPGQKVGLISFDRKTCYSLPKGEGIFDMEDSKLKEVIAKAKLLTGKTNFSLDELTLVREAIVSKKPDVEDTAAALDHIMRNIVSWKPETGKVYPTSKISSLLNQLAKDKGSKIKLELQEIPTVNPKREEQIKQLKLQLQNSGGSCYGNVLIGQDAHAFFAQDYGTYGTVGGRKPGGFSASLGVAPGSNLRINDREEFFDIQLECACSVVTLHRHKQLGKQKEVALASHKLAEAFAEVQKQVQNNPENTRLAREAKLLWNFAKACNVYAMRLGSTIPPKTKEEEHFLNLFYSLERPGSSANKILKRFENRPELAAILKGLSFG